jgi:hypothetical protein
MFRNTQARSRKANAFETTALAVLMAVGCGLETEPNPNKTDSGVSSGAGADGGSGSNAGRGGKGGDSGANGGKGGNSGRGGSGGTSAGGTSGAGTGGSDGGSSGSEAGTGGNAGHHAGCTTHLECTEAAPQCEANGECAGCTTDTPCEDRSGTPRCQRSGGLKQGQCVQCTAPADCPAATPYCTDYACVECAAHVDCQDPARPQCTAGACTACTEDAACTGRAAGPRCVTTAADPAVGTCVACTSPIDCDNPTPECGADHTCKACTGNDACMGRTGKTICDVSSDPAFTGQCVQCTGTQYADCGQAGGGTPYVCDSAARTCSDLALGSAGPCKKCVSDAQCATGMACMQTKFGATNTGNYCLWKQAASVPGAPNQNCGNVRPYIGTEASWTSVDGDSPVVCKPARTTCQAQNDFLNRSCSGETAEGHAQCGAEGVDDAYCAAFLTEHRCTAPCVSYDDCKNTRPADDNECQNQNIGGTFLDVCQFE